VLADDDPRWRLDPPAQAAAACAGGAAVVQLRAKRTGDREALRWAREIRACTRDAGVLFIVNDRFDLALLCEADGVHLGQDDLPPARLPASARARLLVGRSTHTLEQARVARAEEVDYAAFGPVFGTASKDSPYAPRGLALLAEAARAVAPLPLAISTVRHSGLFIVTAHGSAGFCLNARARSDVWSAPSFAANSFASMFGMTSATRACSAAVMPPM